MSAAKFSAGQFTPTKFDTAADKAKFANHFVRFVESDYKETLFSKWFYVRLSNTFGHIAHFDRVGFYGTFFSTDEGKVDFLRQTLDWRCYGQPEFTFCDVEREVQRWVREHGLLDKAQARLGESVEAKERALLRQLRAKYPDEG